MDVFLFENANNYGNAWRLVKKSVSLPPWEHQSQKVAKNRWLSFGWIDSRVKVLPDGRLVQRLSPRREGSHWTELNRQRFKDLECRVLMTDAGRRAY